MISRHNKTYFYLEKLVYLLHSFEVIQHTLMIPSCRIVRFFIYLILPLYRLKKNIYNQLKKYCTFSKSSFYFTFADIYIKFFTAGNHSLFKCTHTESLKVFSA